MNQERCAELQTTRTETVRGPVTKPPGNAADAGGDDRRAKRPEARDGKGGAGAIAAGQLDDPADARARNKACNRGGGKDTTPAALIAPFTPDGSVGVGAPSEPPGDSAPARPREGAPQSLFGGVGSALTAGNAVNSV